MSFQEFFPKAQHGEIGIRARIENTGIILASAIWLKRVFGGLLRYTERVLTAFAVIELFGVATERRRPARAISSPYKGLVSPNVS